MRTPDTSTTSSTTRPASSPEGALVVDARRRLEVLAPELRAYASSLHDGDVDSLLVGVLLALVECELARPAVAR